MWSAGVVPSHAEEGKNDPAVPKQLNDDNEKRKKGESKRDVDVLNGHGGCSCEEMLAPTSPT
jgi:hypothetical protein